MDYKEACQILEIPTSATEEQASKAFKKKAVQYHPDRNKEADAEDKAKRISEAFYYLKDKKFNITNDQSQFVSPNNGGVKWHHVNNPGARWQRVNFGQSFNFDANSEFEDVLFNFFGGNPFQQQFHKLNNVSIEIPLSFKESVLGVTKEIEYQRDEPCPTCTNPEFNHLDGYEQLNPCPECNGDLIKSPENPGVKKQVPQKKKVGIQPGINPNTTIQVKGGGSWNSQYKKYGDLIIKPKIATDPKLSLQDADIVSYEEITLLKALEGGDFEVDTIQGKHTLSLPKGVKNNQKVTLKGQGIPSQGNHVITFKVKYPQDTSKLISFLKENP